MVLAVTAWITKYRQGCDPARRPGMLGVHEAVVGGARLGRWPGVPAGPMSYPVGTRRRSTMGMPPGA